MAGVKIYFKGNDMFVRGEGLNVKGTVLTGSATVEATLERDGVAVSGDSFPITLAHLGQDGDFEGVFVDVLVVVVDEPGMTCHITADDGTDRHGDWKLPINIQDRESA